MCQLSIPLQALLSLELNGVMEFKNKCIYFCMYFFI